jgi:dTDP-glucose 4,6-dehydratase
LETPIQTLRTGSRGTDNALQFALENNARFIMASTSEVYGDPTISPQVETYWGNVNSIGERSCYDEAKRYAEALCMAYWREYQANIGIVRIFNTYGPRLDPTDGRVVSNFVCQALQGHDLTVYGDGSQTRSFCYVDDQVEGIYRLLHSDYVYPVNIGNPDEITIKDFAEEIIKLTGTNQKVVYHPLPINDPLQRQPDISKAKELLGWEAKVGRAEGMKITYEYFKSLSPEELSKEEHKDFSNYIK